LLVGGGNGMAKRRVSVAVLIFKWWMHSSGHRSNILKKKFREVGIGVLTGTYKSCDHATMYTVDFGTWRR
jgi:uncharacterized protein YkwD